MESLLRWSNHSRGSRRCPSRHRYTGPAAPAGPGRVERDDRGAALRRLHRARHRLRSRETSWASTPARRCRPGRQLAASRASVCLPAHRDAARTRWTRRPDQYRGQHLVSAQGYTSARVPGIPLRIADQVLAAIVRAGDPQRPPASAARHTCHDGAETRSESRGLGWLRGVEVISVDPSALLERWLSPLADHGRIKQRRPGPAERFSPGPSGAGPGSGWCGSRWFRPCGLAR